MAGAARYTVILDANVLYPALLRDILLSLAHADIYTARWTATIEDEWTRSLQRDFPNQTAGSVREIAALMRTAIPDCLVTGYEPLIDCMQLPDPDDRHVLAAAVAGHADAIVTNNKKDFTPEVCAGFGVEVQSADEFLINQITLHKIPALAALRQMRKRWERPDMTAAELLALLVRRGLGMTAASLADAVELL